MPTANTLLDHRRAPSERGRADASRGLGVVRLALCAAVLLSTVKVPASAGGGPQLDRQPARMRETEHPSLTISPGHEFSADSYVHRPLSDHAETDPKSAAWVTELRRQIAAHYGTASVNIDDYSPPVFVVGPDQPTVRIEARRSDDPEWTFEPLQKLFDAVPVPDDFAPSPGTDGEAIVYQPSTGRYWEFWRLEQTGTATVNSAGHAVPQWRAAWGGRIDDLRTNPGYFEMTADGITYGTTATGLVLLAGLVTIDEQRRGVVEHALHFAIPQARASVWSFPAQRTDGRDQRTAAIPEGTTFRLPPDLRLEEIDMDPYARMLARAVQKYGMVLRDVSGAVTFYAENPLARYAPHPYHGPGGILRCTAGRPTWACSSASRLRGFPWDELLALRARDPR